MELSDIEDLISLHPGEDESFSLPDNTPIQAALDFSDISTDDFEEDLGESDAEELLDQLAEAYDEAFLEHESASGSSSEAPHSSEPSSSASHHLLPSGGRNLTGVLQESQELLSEYIRCGFVNAGQNEIGIWIK